MRTYDVKCPICGKINRGLFLEETEGWMECDQCGNATRIRLAGENHGLHRQKAGTTFEILLSTNGEVTDDRDWGFFMAPALLVLPELWSAYHSLSERKGRI